MLIHLADRKRWAENPNQFGAIICKTAVQETTDICSLWPFCAAPVVSIITSEETCLFIPGINKRTNICFSDNVKNYYTNEN